MSNNVIEYDVVITDTAWEQAIGHARFLANVNINAANRLVDEFVASCGRLSYMPERCPWLVCEGIPIKKYRKCLFGKNYMVLFSIKGTTVYVSAVVDCRSDYKWLI
jgi:plasmid stabilization system protein ParE